MLIIIIEWDIVVLCFWAENGIPITLENVFACSKNCILCEIQPKTRLSSYKMMCWALSPLLSHFNAKFSRSEKLAEGSYSFFLFLSTFVCVKAETSYLVCPDLPPFLKNAASSSPILTLALQKIFKGVVRYDKLAHTPR